MKNKTILLSMILITSFFVNADNNRFISNEYPKDSKGLFGRVELGILGLRSTNNLWGIESNEKIDSLSSDSDSYSLLSVEVLFDIVYAFSNDMELYFGTPFYADGREGLTLGLRKQLENETLIDISTFFGADTVWENPYIINSDREETWVGYGGINLLIDQIMGTGLGISFSVKGISTDDDELAKEYPTMEREGSSANIQIQYMFDIGLAGTITTLAVFEDGDMDGKNQSYESECFEINYLYTGEEFSFITGTAYCNSKFDGINPVFNDKREDSSNIFYLIYTKYNLLGYNNWYYRIGGMYEKKDSEIDFYDYKQTLGGISIGRIF